MNPDIDRNFLETKLLFILARLEYLKKYYSHTIEELAKDFEKLKAVEKVIQEVVDCAVDINQYIAETLLNTEIRSNKDSFWKIQGKLREDDNGIKKLIDTVSFRNEIVHSYDAGIKIVWLKRSIGYFVDLYRNYVDRVKSLIEQN